MIKALIDTSPMVAIANKHEAAAHRESVKALEAAETSFITTIACITEAMYFLGEAGGWRLQERIWKLLAKSSVTVYSLTDLDLIRMASLMEKYADSPMDFADASLVIAAENLEINKILTFDSDFSFYRINDRRVFEIIP